MNDERDRFCGSFKLYDRGGAPLPHELCWMALALRERSTYDGCEVAIEQPGGALLTALAHANPLFDPSGRLFGAANVLVDITDRAAAEEGLRLERRTPPLAR